MNGIWHSFVLLVFFLIFWLIILCGHGFLSLGDGFLVKNFISKFLLLLLAYSRWWRLKKNIWKAIILHRRRHHLNIQKKQVIYPFWMLQIGTTMLWKPMMLENHCSDECFIGDLYSVSPSLFLWVTKIKLYKSWFGLDWYINDNCFLRNLATFWHYWRVSFINISFLDALHDYNKLNQSCISWSRLHKIEMGSKESRA